MTTPRGREVELYAPPLDAVGKYKPGNTNFRVCGWCAFGVGNHLTIPGVGSCMLAGSCSLIPMSLDDRGRMPPVKIQEKMSRNKRIKAYKELNRIEKKGVSDFKKHLQIIENMLKTVENTRSEEIDDLDTVLWDSECLFVRALGNRDFKQEVIRRNERWMEEFEERIKIRDQYIRELKSSKRRRGKEEEEEEEMPEVTPSVPAS